MSVDLTPYFAAYKALVHIVDGVFHKVKEEFPREVFCREKCSDCCYALFDLTLVEAAYLNHEFGKKFSGDQKNQILAKADKTDRALVKLKRDAYKQVQAGADQLEIVAKMSQERIRCPLLGENDLCIMYDQRPITCRVYGIPTSTLGASHICGRTNFVQGNPYPTLNMDRIYSQLQLISAQMLKGIQSKHVKMHDMLIPVSMALTTIFTDEYLGVEPDKGEELQSKTAS